MRDNDSVERFVQGKLEDTGLHSGPDEIESAMSGPFHALISNSTWRNNRWRDIVTTNNDSIKRFMQSKLQLRSGPDQIEFAMSGPFHALNISSTFRNNRWRDIVTTTALSRLLRNKDRYTYGTCLS